MGLPRRVSGYRDVIEALARREPSGVQIESSSRNQPEVRVQHVRLRATDDPAIPGDELTAIQAEERTAPWPLNCSTSARFTHRRARSIAEGVRP